MEETIMKTKIPIFLITILNFGLTLLWSSEKHHHNWPQWRGINADGASQNGAVPVNWNETTNIKWKTPIPGKGLSTPVIWGNQIFITTAIELDEKATREAVKKFKKSQHAMIKFTGQARTTQNIQQFKIYSIDKYSGEILWQKTVNEQYPHEGIHKANSWASGSCVTDGQHVIAHFGSNGIYCLDMAGKVIWEKDLGDMQMVMAFGEGNSPVLYKNKLVILWDHEGESKIHVFNKNTGKEIWQKNREERTTWATPIVVDINNSTQIIVPGKTRSIGYELETGKEIWTLSGLKEDIVPSPVFDGERIFLMTGFMKSKVLQAINLTIAQGELNNTDAVCWTKSANTPYVPSPLLSNGKLYILEGNKPKLSCIESMTGKIHYENQKLTGMKSFYASPISANGYIYFIDRKGNSIVIKEGDKFKIVGQNKLDDKFDASPVVSDNLLILRGLKHLYCISE